MTGLRYLGKREHSHRYYVLRDGSSLSDAGRIEM